MKHALYIAAFMVCTLVGLVYLLQPLGAFTAIAVGGLATLGLGAICFMVWLVWGISRIGVER